MMARKQLAWEAAARRSILGDKHELKTLEGYWFRPRKYSVPGEEEINAAGMDISGDLPASVIKKLIPIYQKKDIADIKEEEVMMQLTDDELAEMARMYVGKHKSETTVIEKILLHGIGEHNLTENQEASMVVTTDLVDALLQYPATVMEMVGVIKEHNRPLARSTPETSLTSPSGSTSEQISASNAPTLTTEETPSS